MTTDNYHESVMTHEVVEFLDIGRAMPEHIDNQAWYIDATLGTAGHSVEIVKRGGSVIGIDLDQKMLEIAQRRLEEACPASEKFTCFKLVQANFKDIDKITKDAQITNVAGIVFDLGVTNIHLTGSGFSFRDNLALLDMRIDPSTNAVRAADLLNVLREDQLTELFLVVLPYKAAKSLANSVVNRRKLSLFETVSDFLEVCQTIKSKKHLHFATLPFLALRIAVNSELQNLEIALPKAYELLDNGARLVVISFHSAEDEIVKKSFRDLAKKGGRVITENYIKPSLKEIEKNPKARSARLRVFEKYEN